MALVLALPLKAVHGQPDSTITLDVLRAPASPASVLLGIAESEIQRPTTPTDFMLTIRQATSSFSQLPASFAVDVAPSHFSKRHRSLGDLIGVDNTGKVVDRKFCRDAWNNLVFGAAFTNEPAETPDLALPRLALGVRTSLVQAVVDDETRSSLQKLRGALSIYNRASKARVNTNFEQDAQLRIIELKQQHFIAERTHIDTLLATKRLNAIERERLTRTRASIHDSVVHYMTSEVQLKAELSRASPADVEALSSQAQALFAAAHALKVRRVGFFADAAIGLVLDFRESRFDNSHMSSFGAWSTSGYECANGIAMAGMIRYLLQPGQAITTPDGTLSRTTVGGMDIGGRFTYDSPEGSLALSLEGIHRMPVTTARVDPTYRLVFNAQYAYASNKLLTFSFGRDFDGTVSQAGNLVAALNVVMGLGGNFHVN